MATLYLCSPFSPVEGHDQNQDTIIREECFKVQCWTCCGSWVRPYTRVLIFVSQGGAEEVARLL